MPDTTDTLAGPIEAGTFVNVRFELLAAGARSEQVPADTAGVPLLGFLRGFLESAASVGEEATIITLTGRRVRGVIVDASPQHSHGFGLPDPDIMTIASRVRDWIESKQQ